MSAPIFHSERVGRNYDIRLWHMRDGREGVVIDAGKCRTERMVPPAGEAYAWDREVWTHRIEVTVSPTGRSVMVWVDGKRVA